MKCSQCLSITEKKAFFKGIGYYVIELISRIDGVKAKRDNEGKPVYLNAPMVL